MPTTKQHCKEKEKLTKYRQLAFEMRERRGSGRSRSIGIKALKVDLNKMLENNELLDEVVTMMQKTVQMDSASIVRRVMSGLIQEDNG